MIKEIFTNSDRETEAAGAAFAEELLKREDGNNCVFVAMYGDLGVGKTAFVRGAASVLSPTARVQSPTYTIVNEYRGGSFDLLHFDFYRIEDEDSLDSIGFWDYLDRKAIAFGEWSEKIPFALPRKRYAVSMEKTDDGDGRRIRIEKIG